MENKKIKLYQPSNATEGDSFHSDWCRQCARDKAMSEDLPLDECDDDQQCEILANTFCYSIDDPEYPKEWLYCEKTGSPICTAFIPTGEPIPPLRDDKTIDMFGDEQ